MDGVAFLLSIVAIVWLAFWTMRDPRTPSRRWWPFDMREPGGGQSEPPAPRRRPPQRGRT